MDVCLVSVFALNLNLDGKETDKRTLISEDLVHLTPVGGGTHRKTWIDEIKAGCDRTLIRWTWYTPDLSAVCLPVRENRWNTFWWIMMSWLSAWSVSRSRFCHSESRRFKKLKTYWWTCRDTRSSFQPLKHWGWRPTAAGPALILNHIRRKSKALCIVIL